MGNTSVKKTDDDKNATLNEYLEHVNRQLRFKQRQAEVDDITEAVIEMVNIITNKIGNIDRRFEISRVRFVGSMAEGTSNSVPNEFDFLVVVKSLSMTDDIFLTRDCNGKKGYVHVGIRERENSNLTDMWKDVVEKGKIKSSKNGIFRMDGFREKFKVVLRNAFHFVKVRHITISKETGHLKCYTAERKKHGPACVCAFKWTSRLDTKSRSKHLRISVDITPALQFEGVENIIDREEVGNEMLYQRLKDEGVLMAISAGNQVCSDGLCFKLTFTNTELSLMREMSEHHRKCYRILKYLFNGLHPYSDSSCIIFHSYALKTFVLRHHIENTCEGESMNLAKCIDQIITETKMCLSKSVTHGTLYEINLPCIFLPSLNIFHRRRLGSTLGQSSLGITLIRKLLKAVSKMNFPDDEEKKIKKIQELFVSFTSHRIADLKTT